MTRQEQSQFVIDLINNVRVDILKSIEGNKIPEEWDGIELREFISEKFDRERSSLLSDKRYQRSKDYLNHILIKNL